MTQQVKEKASAGNTGLDDATGGAGTVFVSSAIIPQTAPECNTRQFSKAVSSLIDQAVDRCEWHTEHAERCRRDIAFYRAALAYHQEQARRALAVRRAVERLAVA